MTDRIGPIFFFCFFKALCLAGALADGFHPRNSRRHGRQGRRLQQNFRRQGRNRAFRRGRTEELEAAPLGLYGAADTTDAPEVLPPPGDYASSALPTDYEYDDAALSGYAADEGLGADADPNLAMLEKAVPGIPGEDYPIFAEVPESGFSCDGQVDGGKIKYQDSGFMFIQRRFDFRLLR